LQFKWAPAMERPRDHHWNWREKTRQALASPLLNDICCVEGAGAIQGMMLIAKGTLDCISRHPEHLRHPIIYIELLATAPGNRARLTQQPLYKGVGRTLFMTAVHLSREEGLFG